ncbi:MAG: MoaD/ThiS family protein [Actinomycetota bacterium]
MVTVKFSATLKATTGTDEIEVDAPSVRRLVRLLDERWPGIGEQLTAGMAVAINGEIIPDAMFEELPDGAEVHFLPAIAGG